MGREGKRKGRSLNCTFYETFDGNANIVKYQNHPLMLQPCMYFSESTGCYQLLTVSPIFSEYHLMRILKSQNRTQTIIFFLKRNIEIKTRKEDYNVPFLMIYTFVLSKNSQIYTVSRSSVQIGPSNCHCKCTAPKQTTLHQTQNSTRPKFFPPTSQHNRTNQL